MLAVQPWLGNLTVQQQTVLLLACRGFDGTVKHSSVKPFTRTIRAHVLIAATYGRPWTEEDGYNDFMTLDYIAHDRSWGAIGDDFFKEWDSFNVHAALHFLHAAEILGYKLPRLVYRERWNKFYKYTAKECLHMIPETEEQMDYRLNDWGRQRWGKE